MISDSGDPVTARGVCWSTNLDPTTVDNHMTNGSGTGSFTSIITGLPSGTLYHVRVYTINSFGTAYGSDKSLNTENPPPGS